MADVDIERPEPGMVVFRVRGTFGPAEATLLRKALNAEVGCTHVRMDIDQVDYLDPSGLGAVVGALRRAREGGAAVTVRCSRPSLRRLLRTTGFDRAVCLDPPDDDGPAGVREPARPGPGGIGGPTLLDPPDQDAL